MPLAREGPGSGQSALVPGVVAHQNDLTVFGTDGGKDLAGLGQAQVRATAAHGHDLGGEGVEHGQRGLGIVAQGRDHKGVPGEGDQSDLAVATRLEDVRHLVAGACQA